MKILVNRKSMQSRLETVSKALPSKSVLPINENFLFVIEDNTCYVYARNGNLQIKGQFAVESKENFSMCIPGKTLMNTIGLMSDEDINFNYNDEKFVLNISAGKKRYKLTGFNPKDFVPQATTEEGLRISLRSSVIIPKIATMSRVVKWDDLRPQLAGITIASIEDDITVSGAHEAFFFCRSLLSIAPEKDFGIVLPRDISIALGGMKGAGDTDITIYDRSVFFNVDGFELQSTLLNVPKVVELEKLFCHDRKKYIVLDREELSLSLKRLINYSTDKSIIRLELKGLELGLSCENEDFGKDAEEILDVESVNADDCVVGISIKYLSVILSSIVSDKIKLFMVDYKRPVFLQKYENMDDAEVWGCAPMILQEHC